MLCVGGHASILWLAMHNKLFTEECTAHIPISRLVVNIVALLREKEMVSTIGKECCKSRAIKTAFQKAICEVGGRALVTELAKMVVHFLCC